MQVSSSNGTQKANAPNTLVLRFDAGTLVLDRAAQDEAVLHELKVFRSDSRTKQWRTPAYLYRQAITALVRRGIPHQDAAQL